VVVLTCNSRTWKLRQKNHEVKVSLGLRLSQTNKNKLNGKDSSRRDGTVLNPSTQEAEAGG
jgi:hypothetical protein